MEPWNRFVNENGYDEVEPAVSLISTGPFDTWMHCLICHTTEHSSSDVRGHQWFDCFNGSPANLYPVGTNLDWVRSIPRNAETAPFLRLVSLIGGQHSHDVDFKLHIRKRDDLLQNIHETMVTRYAEPEWEPWVEAMSAFHIMTKYFKKRWLYRPNCVVRKFFVQDLDDPQERALDFLHRVAIAEGEVVPMADFGEAMRRTEIALTELKNEFDVRWTNWEQQVQTFLDTNPVMVAFDPEDAAWMRKAFNVVLKTQPKLELHPQFVSYFTFPDVEQVARDEGMET